MRSLHQSFFTRPTPVVAHDLIGCIIEHTLSANDIRALRLVETEAYLAENDAACHASLRRTKRNEAMFDVGGVLYVYLVYGMHHCANIVTEVADRGCAVLLRAGEVIPSGQFDKARAQALSAMDARIAAGPGKLAKYMGFTPAHNHASVCDGTVRVFEDDLTLKYRKAIVTTTRIGITKDADLLLRFYAANSTAVSKTAS